MKVFKRIVLVLISLFVLFSIVLTFVLMYGKIIPTKKYYLYENEVKNNNDFISVYFFKKMKITQNGDNQIHQSIYIELLNKINSGNSTEDGKFKEYIVIVKKIDRKDYTATFDLSGEVKINFKTEINDKTNEKAKKEMIEVYNKYSGKLKYSIKNGKEIVKINNYIYKR